MKLRVTFFVVLAAVLVFTVFGLPYAKIGSYNQVWAQSYLTPVTSNATCTNIATGGANSVCSYQTGWGYATFTGGCNVLVYRMGPDAILNLDPNVVCVNDQLQFFVFGTGNYFFYPSTANPKPQSTAFTLPVNFQP